MKLQMTNMLTSIKDFFTSMTLSGKVVGIAAILLVLALLILESQDFAVPQFEAFVPYNAELFLKINSFNNRWLDIFFLNFLNGVFVYNNLGTGWLVVPIFIHLLVSYRAYLVTFFVSFSLQIITIKLLKSIFYQVRPTVIFEISEFHAMLPETQNYSFPSGDVAFAFSLAVVMWFAVYENKWLLALYILYPIIIMWQRIYIGVHFPVDVLAGAVIGTVCAIIAITIFKQRIEKKDEKNEIRLQPDCS